MNEYIGNKGIPKKEKKWPTLPFFLKLICMDAFNPVMLSNCSLSSADFNKEHHIL